MNLLIHIEVNEVNFLHFQKDLLKWASEHLDDINIIDFDNHSDSYMVDSILKLSKAAQKIAVIIDVESFGTGLGGVIKFLNALLRSKKENILVIMNGQHEMLVKMIRIFRYHHMNLNIDNQKEKLVKFFKA